MENLLMMITKILSWIKISFEASKGPDNANY